MNDRAPIRDRTLVLRILVPRLDQRLREKMKEVEETAAADKDKSSPPSKTGSAPVDSYLDLEGVSCEPSGERNRALWNFRCDGVTYPAQLVNLPCPVEVHKTLDHASYYKAADVAQMLIVYEDDLSFEEAQEKPIEGFPSYYHSGLTPPMKRVVERRFERCFSSRDRKALPPPRLAVQEVEEELKDLMGKLHKDEKAQTSSNKRTTNKLPVLTSATKQLVEVEDEVVDYEPWMDDGGKQLQGIQFEAEDSIAKAHPEIWLSPATIKSIKDELHAAEEAEKAKIAAKEAEAAAAAAAAAPKKKKSKKKSTPRASEEPAAPKPKKGIASRKSETPVDELTQAAMGALTGEDLMDSVLGSDDLFADLDLDFSGMDDNL